MATRKTAPASRNRIGLIGIGLLSIASLALVIALWLSGVFDTKEAMSDGRRLLITLDTGAIDGKQISLESTDAAPAEVAPAAATSPAAVDSPQPESPPPDSSNATPESPPEAAASSPADATFVQEIPLDLGQNTQIKPATVQLAEVKDTLLEKTTVGNIPIIGPKNMRSWQYYAKPYSHKGHLPTIAIIVSGLGENKQVTDGALRLPENMSLSFSPYAKDIVSWTHAARVAGHEIMLDLPLEPSNYPASDPGPNGLLVGKGVEENGKRMQWLMSRAEGFIGFVTPPNESFSSDDAAFQNLAEQLTSRGLMLSMAREPAKTNIAKILADTKTAYIIADTIIDEDLTDTAIQARLLFLEKTAKSRGFAVGLAQPFPLTIQQLALWSAQLEKDGFTLVPLTFITKLKFQ